MKLINRIIPIMGLIALAPTATFAAGPVKNTKCQNVNLVEVKGNGGYYFSEDCKTVYVLPPNFGKLSINGYQEMPNLDKRCSAVRTIEDSNLIDSNIENTYKKRMARNEKRILEIDSYIEEGLLPIGKSVEDLEAEQDRLMKKNADYNKYILDSFNNYTTRMSFYGGAEGGEGTFTIDNKYAELLSAFKEKNENSGLSFQRMPMEQSYVSIVDRSSDTQVNKVEMPAVMDLKIPGIGALPSLIPAGEIGKAGGPTEPVASTNDNVDIFGNALSGQIRLSSLGACGVRQANVSGEFTGEEVKAYIAPNVVYQYQVEVERNHHITFNMQELITRIHEQTKKSGLFSRKTVNRLIDSRKTSSWITFHVESGDTRFDYDDKYIEDVKKEFIDRAIAKVIAIKTNSPVGHLALLDPSGKNGADVISGELGKCPNLYCQIGAAGFKVLSSIFGNTQAVAEMRQNFQASDTETLTAKKKVTMPGTMTFK